MVEIDLNDPANQTKFSALVGISQQAVSKQVEKGALPKDGTYSEWLLMYVEHLREQAAGRGGDTQADLTRARTEEAEVKAALGRLQVQEKLGRLVDIEEARELLTNWASFANREFRSAIDRLCLDIESVHGIAISSEVKDKNVSAAIGRVKNYSEKLTAPAG